MVGAGMSKLNLWIEDPLRLFEIAAGAAIFYLYIVLIVRLMGKRTTSSVPTQALFLMNNPFVRQQAEFAAKRLLEEQSASNDTRIKYAYQLTLGRQPTASEGRIVLDFLKAGQEPEAVWTQVFQSLFASLDFRYLN